MSVKRCVCVCGGGLQVISWDFSCTSKDNCIFVSLYLKMHHTPNCFNPHVTEKKSCQVTTRLENIRMGHRRCTVVGGLAYTGYAYDETKC